MALHCGKEYQERIFYFNCDLTEVPKNIFTKLTHAEDTIAVLSKFIYLENIAKYLLQEGFIAQYEFTLLTNPLADANTLIPILQKAGGDRRKVERFYYCLMKSYEDGGPISHKEYARHLRYCVAKEMNLSPLIPDKNLAKSMDESIIYTKQIISKLQGLQLSEQSSQDLAVNLGIENPSQYGTIKDAGLLCQKLMEQNDIIHPEQIIKALVWTKGLGRHVSSLAYPIYSIESEAFLIGLSHGRWKKIADYIGYTAEEIKSWDTGLPEESVLKFYEEWKLPDCGAANEQMLRKLASNAELSYNTPRRQGVSLDAQFKGEDHSNFSEDPSLEERSAVKGKYLAKDSESDDVRDEDYSFEPQFGVNEKNLIDACENGNGDHIRILLVSHNANPNIWTKGRTQPIHIVANNGCLAGIKALIDKGADINSRRKEDGKTPLMIASVKGNIEVVACLIEAGGDVNVKDKFGMGSLHDKDVLENQNIVSTILKAREADIDLPTNSGDLSPLVMACMINSDKVKLTIDTLIGYNARVDGLDKGNVTPLGVCAVDGNLEVMESLLLYDAQVDKQDKSGRTALLRACTFNQMEAVKKLLNANANPSIADNDGDTPVMEAVSNNNEDMLDLLISHGANVDIPKKLYKEDGSEVLDYITPLSFAASKGSTAIVRKLVDAKADVNYVSEMQPYTPLVHAVYGNSEEIFKLLMSLPFLEKSLEKLSWAVVLSVRLHREDMTKELIRALGGYKHLMIVTKDNDRYLKLREALEKLTQQMKEKCEQPLERQQSVSHFVRNQDELIDENAQSKEMALRICDEFVEIVMSVVTNSIEPSGFIELAKRQGDAQLVEFFQRYFNNKREKSGSLFCDFIGFDDNSLEGLASETPDNPNSLALSQNEGNSSFFGIDSNSVLNWCLKQPDRPCRFVFSQKDLISGHKLKIKLQEIGRNDFMDEFQTALLHLFLPDDNIVLGFTLNADMWIGSLLGLDTIQELRACHLLPQEAKAFTDEDHNTAITSNEFEVVNQKTSENQLNTRESEETVETLRKKVQQLESKIQELLPLESRVKKLEDEFKTLSLLVHEVQK